MLNELFGVQICAGPREARLEDPLGTECKGTEGGILAGQGHRTETQTWGDTSPALSPPAPGPAGKAPGPRLPDPPPLGFTPRPAGATGPPAAPRRRRRHT